MLLEAFLSLLALILGLLVILGPRKIVLGALNLFKEGRKLYLQLKGSTEQKEIERHVMSGQAWADYCDTLKAAGTTMFAPGAPMTPFDQAEGYRYLTRLMRGSLMAFMECKNFEKPKFSAIANGWQEGPVKLGSDNPDNLYESCALCPQFAYRLTLTRNSVDFLGIGSQAGTYGQPGGLKTVQTEDCDDLEIKDGKISILISPENFDDSKNFLKMDHTFSEALIIVRQTFRLRAKETPAEIDIYKVGEFRMVDEKTLGEFKPSEKMNDLNLSLNEKYEEKDKFTCDQLSEALHNSGLFVTGASIMFANWAHGFQKHENELPLFPVERANAVGGDPLIRYYHSYWRLADDEALVVTVKPPECFSWNFQINNHWMESLDYRQFTIHVNAATATYRKDGSVVIVVTLKKPETDIKEYTWLSTTGHNSGTMCWRWTKPKCFETVPTPLTKVVKHKELNEVLRTL